MNKEFDKIINKKIGSTEVKPSAGLWDKIEAELPEDKQKKVFFLLPLFGTPIFKNAMAASVIFLLGGFSAFYFLNQDNNHTIAKDNNTTTQNTENNISQSITAQIEENLSDENLKEKDSFTKKTNQINYSNNKTNTNPSNNKTITSPPNNNNNINASKNNYHYSNYATSSNSINHKKIAKAYFDPKVSNSNKNVNQNMSVSDYVWVYDKNTGAYSVFLKEENKSINQFNDDSNKELYAETEIQNDIDEPSFMSIIEEKEKEEKPEILEQNNESVKSQHFKSQSNKINYKGFWLGPNAGYEAIFIANSVYSGGSFGIDAGYDFGGSWGIQSGLKYAINSKSINIIDSDGQETRYRSEFNSVHIPVFARYKFTKLTQLYSKPLSFNIVGGLDYAFVNTKNLHQLGLNLGAEYDIFTQADLMLTIGVRGGMYNNLNLYKLDFPEQINRYNYSLSAYLSVRFIDWAKKK